METSGPKPNKRTSTTKQFARGNNGRSKGGNDGRNAGGNYQPNRKQTNTKRNCILKKIQSIFKKGKTLIKTGMEPYEVGEYNFHHPKPEVEKVARERAKVCDGCEFNHIEPIDAWKIKDEIQTISERSCADCGCLLPYKVRQNLEVCKKW